ncbi:hypothetical protein [Buchananella hordeovulneris]|uniref:Gram-positive cocci surface proteins LPxTG domain-containing protein n=1 Tax=Buchananella hordeovulneris TaxID=52770 RepID=A0A1Q5PUG4_9ACTO|nr:hypothetical protein [Buchananella hordeovulneris]OKL51119.1 hypothetical protein BSZ40_09445 [Buchananella hordeovulneris]
MSKKKAWAKGTVAGVGALTLLASTVFTAAALNRGTQPGEGTQGCDVSWTAQSVLDIDLAENDPNYGNLVHDEKGNPAGTNYQWTGFIKEVSPKLGHAGYMEIGHHYQDGADPTPVRVATGTTKQHWRVNLGTNKALKNAKVIFTLPPEVRGKEVFVDLQGGVDNVNTWGNEPYTQYRAGRTPLTQGAVVDNGNGTWTINIGDLPAMNSRVVDFYVRVGTSLNLTDQFVATAVLTARGTDPQCTQRPPQPQDRVEFGQWTDGAITCEKGTVTQTRTKTTTPFTWDDGTQQWVPGTPVVTQETQERDKTEQEREQCKPQDLVEFGQWEDGEVTCAKTTVTQTRTKTTTPHVWDNNTKTWKPGTPVVTTETQERQKTQAEHEQCKPADRIEYGEWTDGAITCDKPTVTQTRSKSVTTFTFDDATKTWKPGAPVVTEETQERDKTQAEHEQCKPETKTEFSQWADEQLTCDKPTVTQKRTKTVTEYTFDDATKTWKPGTPVVTTETQERDKTQAEHEQCKPETKTEFSQWADEQLTCDKPTVTQKRTKTVTEYTFDDATKTWKPGAPVVTEETQERDKTQAEHEQCKPEPKVEFSAWEDGKVTCESTKVTQKRTKTVTEYTFDDATKTWKPGTPVVTEETQERDKTMAEHEQCKPESKVEISQWQDEKVTCESPKVKQTRTKTVTSAVFDEATKTWKMGEPVVTIEAGERDKTDAEKAACAPGAPGKQLAKTGSPILIIGSIAGLLALAGGALVIAKRRRA